MRRNAQVKQNGMFLPLTGLFVSSVIIAILFFIPSVGFGYSSSIDPAPDNLMVGDDHTVTVRVDGAAVGYMVVFSIERDQQVVDSFTCLSEDGISARSDITTYDRTCPGGVITHTYSGTESGTDTIRVKITYYGYLGFKSIPWVDEGADEVTAPVVWNEPAPKELSVDVNLGKNPVVINLRKQMRVIQKRKWKKYTSVLRLMVNGSSDFNAADAAEFPFSLCGPDGDISVAPKRVRLKDKDRDGNMDLILAFHVPDLVSKGLVHADCTGLLLRGQTADGTAIKANLPVEVVGTKCRKPWKKKYKKDRWKKKKVFEYSGKNGKKTKVVVKYRGKNCKKHKVVVIKRSNKNGLKKVTVRKYGKNGLKRFEIRRYGKNGLVNKVMWKSNR